MLKSEENRDIIIYEPKIKQECIKEPNNISSNSTVENSKKNNTRMLFKNSRKLRNYE